ncbi:tetratricopeptide repeat protein [Amphibiibacter pelophylacis]|uniref:Tetratricopeptide repeat protein n=1 Tax=Amphibiibacter pelophylacis TaxID=1799477 RepID=A0ACC6P2I5_9BURK
MTSARPNVRPSRLFRHLAAAALVGSLGGLLSSPAWGQEQEIQKLMQQGQNSEALALVDQALAKTPGDNAMRFRRGVLLTLMERRTEALATFEKLAKDVPNSPMPWNNIATILASQGEYDKARTALEKAIRTNPAYATAYQNLGDIYAQLASQAYSKALQINGKNDKIPPKLALLRELNGDGAAAVTPAVKPVTVASAAAAPASAAPAAPATAAPAAPAKPETKPVAKPAEAAAPAAKPAAAEAPAAPKPAATSPADVEAALKAWAQAWADKNMSAYLGAYTPDFRGSYSSRAAWEKDRRDRIVGKKNISVALSGFSTRINGSEAQVSFTQQYRAPGLNSTSRKSIRMQQQGGRWLISDESGR